MPTYVPLSKILESMPKDACQDEETTLNAARALRGLQCALEDLRTCEALARLSLRAIVAQREQGKSGKVLDTQAASEAFTGALKAWKSVQDYKGILRSLQCDMSVIEQLIRDVTKA